MYVFQEASKRWELLIDDDDDRSNLSVTSVAGSYPCSHFRGPRLSFPSSSLLFLAGYQTCLNPVMFLLDHVLRYCADFSQTLWDELTRNDLEPKSFCSAPITDALLTDDDSVPFSRSSQGTRQSCYAVICISQRKALFLTSWIDIVHNAGEVVLECRFCLSL